MSEPNDAVPLLTVGQAYIAADTLCAAVPNAETTSGTYAALKAIADGRAVVVSAAEIERLRAENEALRKDAERYRWLRAQFCAEESINANIQVGLNESFLVPATECGEWPSAVDVAIDQAIAKERQS